MMSLQAQINLWAERYPENVLERAISELKDAFEPGAGVVESQAIEVLEQSLVLRRVYNTIYNTLEYIDD